ncbi:nuclear transport factor 2 family protein [Spongiivirga sp. MCCC 1A20706]|uniref:nuclear transport factor 2 family protein n=1 Tax=Spongiivirga sp. MCCC 1A20706 TaxID=3160963 RepID=UPI003977521E
MKTLLIALLMGISLQIAAQAKEMAIENVTKASYNYIDAFYQVDTSLAYQSVHKDLRKVGWWYSDKTKSYSDALEMPFDKLVDLAKKWNLKGDRADKNSIREVKILEVSDKIAVAKVTAVWGIDYLNLVNTKEGWKIINIVWQSKPKFSLHE